MRPTFSVLVLAFAPLTATAQMDHSAHTSGQHATGAPTHAGQEAFATISEIVALLKADPKTDWARVDIEALRQHLIDMDDVTLRSQATRTIIESGLEMEVNGTGRTLDAVRRMVLAHAPMLDAIPEYHATAAQTATGVRLIVVARDPRNAGVVSRIRALGFMGLMTEGAHHQLHHLAIARGEGESAHKQ